jgi:rubredoxin
MYMNMYKCDICGQLYEALKLDPLRSVIGTHRLVMRDLSLTQVEYNKKEIDICPECYLAIKKAIDARRKKTDPFEDDLK